MLETSSWTDALCALPAPLQAPTERLLERFQAACALTGAAPPVASLPQVFALSPFCAEVAIAQPAQWLATLAMPGETREPAAYAERCAALFTGLADETRLRARVRQFRNLELAAITYRDLLGEVSLDTVLAELSALADALVRVLGTVAVHLARLP